MRSPQRLSCTAVIALAMQAAPAASANEGSPALSWNCNGCHGFEGVSQGPLTPSIAGMNPRLLFTIMRGYQLDERPSTIMGRIAKGYTTLELRELARYFAGLPWQDRRSSASAAAIAKGESLHLELCADCHDDAGRYQDKEIPRLTGQLRAYLLMRMADYQDEDKGLPQPPKMQRRIKPLTAEELRVLSDYYAR